MRKRSDAGAPRAGPRPVARRRSLPGGRAVVGGLLVALAAVLTWVAGSRPAGPTGAPAVVARRSLGAGSRLTAADLSVRRIDLPPDVSARTFASPGAVAGAVAVAPIAAGELVQASSVVAHAPDGYELAIPTDGTGLVDGVAPGERVDVLATYGSGAEAFTVAVVLGAVVIDVPASAPDAFGAVAAPVLTVAVHSRDDALAVTHAIHAGAVTLVRATGTARAGTGPTPTYRTPASP
jgi:SAF domain